MDEIYVSTDVETDGPIPGPHSMLSLGSAAYSADKKLLSTFSANLETLPEAMPHPKTTAWWATQPQAWAACRENPEAPALVMARYVAWLKALPGRPVFVAYPAGFDFLFVYWYLMRFAGESPFSHSALDMKSFAMAVMRSDFRASTEQHMPAHWFDPLPHSHVALDDAIGQGALFCNMLQANRAADHAGTGAVLFAKDLALVARFYEHVLPMPVATVAPDHVVLRQPGFELVVHAIPPQIAADIVIASPPQRRDDSAVKAVFAVDSLARVRDTVAAFGGRLDAPEREWQYGALRVCDGIDPEGNVVQFRERRGVA